MLNHEVIALAHREAWRYKKSDYPNQSDTYTFNRATLLEFARKLSGAEREACAKVCEEVADETAMGEADGADACANAIRSRHHQDRII